MTSTTRMSGADYLCVAGVVVIWGCNFVIMKLGLKGLSPMLLGALRFSVASLPFLLFVKPPALPWRYVIVVGLLQGLGQFGLLFTALKFGMTAGMASVVMQMQAMFTILLSGPLLNEHANVRQWAGLVVAAAGLAAIALGHGEGPGQMTLIGFVLTLAAASMWGASNVVIRFAQKTGIAYDPAAFVIWSSLMPIVPFFLLSILLEGGDATWAMLRGIGLHEGLAVLYLGLLATLLAYSLWTRLLQRHRGARVSPYSLLVPVIGLWAGALAFDEQLSALQWTGVATIMVGLLINQFALRR
ncbi:MULTISPECIES: EamA family transporter [unclassified Achromobacter]|uniref:EamA family transporter n=1 Tax=unclassified Achromobacter TaxID=2626865 RepID=UPI000B51731D|nr:MULTISPECIES: EamA family transporter [unclassified Achromobacter]OWT74717.1 O-acetylserine/cysteine exporter [Achromobacter sp. HZ34]OWT79184.1 O-acetylserine/cysteine exporter [Achromobacter sp. HZ28]